MNFNYTYNSGTDYAAESVVSTIFIFYAVFIVVYGLVSIASYVLRGIGFYTIAKNQGDENAWMAFIPFARKYQQGQLAGDILLKTKAIKNTGIWFLGLPIAWGILSYLVSMIMGISMVGKMIRYGLLSSVNSYEADMFGIIEGLLGFIIIYAILATIYQAIYKVFFILIDKSILEKYTTGNMPVIHAVLCALVPLYETICVFVISRRIKSEEDKKKQEELMYYNMLGRGEFSAQNMNQQGFDMNPMPQERGDVAEETREIVEENKISEE